jgi:hypothetical protein
MAKKRKPNQNVEQLQPDFLLCRDLMHPWQPYDAKIDRKAGEIHRILKCPRCATERDQVLNMDGSIIRNSYRYPDGYQMEGVGQLSARDRAHVRMLNMTRFSS